MADYGFSKVLNVPFETVKKKVIEELKKEGFGIMTEINLHEKFREKIGIEFKKYVILGACNPVYAHKAVFAEENIGLLLPCNVIVYENNHDTVLAIIKPTVAMQMIENVTLCDLALDVEARLRKVFDAVMP